MRTRKIRGHNKKQKQILDWQNENLLPSDRVLEGYGTDYIKIIVHPWCDISIINSKIPEPNRKTKMLLLEALLNLYDSWEKELQKQGKDYSLKLWLYENRFSKSEVVCGVGEFKDFYNDSFHKPTEKKQINLDHYPKLKSRMEAFSWEYHWDELHFFDNEVGKEEDYINQKDYLDFKKWFSKMLEKPHRKYELKTKQTYGAKELLSFKVGTIWVGEKKKQE